MTYRDYQRQAINKAVTFINDKKDNKKPFIVSPTGSGKSWIAAGIADEVTSPIIVLQPSKELLMQNYEKYTSLGNEASIFSASLKTKEIGHVTFATIGSIKGIAHRFKEAGVKVIIIDECHVGSGTSNSLNKFIKQLGNVKVIGLTATPVVLLGSLEGPTLKMLNRTRKSFWNNPLHITQISEIIEKGFWADLKYEREDINEDLLQYNVSRSEFTEDSMKEMYDYNDVEGKVLNRIDTLKQERRSILIFCPDVASAKSLSQKIEGSRVVWGDMPVKERTEVIQGFKNHLIQVVINCNVLAIGFDFEELDCVVDTVPTASIARYYQKLGRGCRPHPNKKDALLLDYSGNFNRFGELKNITFEEDPRWGWNMFSGDRMLTNVSLDNSNPIFKTGCKSDSEVKFEFGRYAGKLVSECPMNYLNWMLKEFDWNRTNIHIKDEILRLKAV